MSGPAAEIARLTASSLSKRLADAGFGVSVMAYRERGRPVRNRALVIHHGHADVDELTTWLTDRGLVVKPFGPVGIDVSTRPGKD